VTPNVNKRARVFLAIAEERRRQEFLKSQGAIPFSCADEVPMSLKHLVLSEEVGEVAKAIQERDWTNLRDELTQCAAVCVAWLESLGTEE